MQRVQRLFAWSIIAGVLIACGADAEPIAGPGTSTGTNEPTPGSSGAGNGPSGAATSTTPGESPTPGGGTDAPGSKAVRFIAMGDTGTGSNAQTKVGNAVAAFCQARGCDFVQLLGDNIYESGVSSPDDPLFQSHFEVPYAAVELDFYAVLGNHDYGVSGLGIDLSRGKHQVDYSKRSKKWKMPDTHYHFTPPTSGGAVEIFALDTNLMMFGQDEPQRAAFPKWIADSKAEWKIAVGHHPYLSNGPHGNAGNYDAKFGISIPPINGKGVKSFFDDVICGKVDLYLSGHDHSRQWLNESCKGTELAVSGAGAKATELPGNNATLFQSLELGFLYIVIEGKKLTAEFVDENGNVEFTHTILKP